MVSKSLKMLQKKKKGGLSKWRLVNVKVSLTKQIEICKVMYFFVLKYDAITSVKILEKDNFRSNENNGLKLKSKLHFTVSHWLYLSKL